MIDLARARLKALLFDAYRDELGADTPSDEDRRVIEFLVDNLPVAPGGAGADALDSRLSTQLWFWAAVLGEAAEAAANVGKT